MAFDPVNRPSHYTSGRKFETIDVIEDWELGFCLGNTVKYISRAGRKLNHLEDLKKAKWYLERAIQQETAALENDPVQRDFLTPDNSVLFGVNYNDILADASADPVVYAKEDLVCVDPWDPTLGPMEPSEEQERICEATSKDWEDFWQSSRSDWEPRFRSFDCPQARPARPNWDNDDKWMLDGTQSN